MTAKVAGKQVKGERTSDGKDMHLKTAGGCIVCLRCTARSIRTKLQCGRPALKTSPGQKCQFHGGRLPSEETLQRIAGANTTHGKSTRKAKALYRHQSILVLQLQDAMEVLEMGSGPKIRGRKPEGYQPILSKNDVVRMILEHGLHMV